MGPAQPDTWVVTGPRIPFTFGLTYLLSTRSEKLEVFGVGSISVAILPSCQYINYCIII